MKLKKCQENQIFQKKAVDLCLQIKVKIVNYQIQHQTNLHQSTIRKIIKLKKKEKPIKRKKIQKRQKKINKKDKLIVKSRKINKKCENKTLNKLLKIKIYKNG